jgi:hypothetical protein
MEDHESGVRFLHEKKLESVQRRLQKYEEMLSELIQASGNNEEML